MRPGLHAEHFSNSNMKYLFHSLRRRGSKVIASTLSVMTCKEMIFARFRAMHLELASKQPRNLPGNIDRVTQTGANLVADLTWTEASLARYCLEANVH
jgi:hypothetical protein